jgi:hypothetical protein
MKPFDLRASQADWNFSPLILINYDTSRRQVKNKIFFLVFQETNLDLLWCPVSRYSLEGHINSTESPQNWQVLIPDSIIAIFNKHQPEGKSEVRGHILDGCGYIYFHDSTAGSKCKRVCVGLWLPVIASLRDHLIRIGRALWDTDIVEYAIYKSYFRYCLQ